MLFFARRTTKRLSEAIHPDRHSAIPPNGINGMITDVERRALACFAKNIWENGARRNGVLVDGGCFVGASTVALAEGLRQSSLPERERRGRIWSYDLFRATPAIASVYLSGSGVQPGDSFQAIFEKNVTPYSDYIVVHAGDIRCGPFPTQPIAILFLDVMWSWDSALVLGRNFYPKLEPGRSLLIHQDFVYPFYPWVILSMGQLAAFFAFAYNVQYSSVVFDITRRIKEHHIDDPRNLPLPVALAIYDRFIKRLEGWGRGSVALGKAFYLASLNHVPEARRLVADIERVYLSEGLVTQYIDSIRGYCDRVDMLGRPIPLDDVVGV